MPIENTELGIVKVPVNPLQLRKALSPIEMTDVGTTMDVNPEQFEKAAFSIIKTDGGISYVPVFEVGTYFSVICE